MAPTAVQRLAKSGTSVASLAIGAGDGWVTPTAGNVLVVTANSDATVSTPATYTAGPSVVDGNGAYIFWKIANGTESTVTVTPGSAANTSMTACEYSGLHAIPLDTSNSTTNSGSGAATTTSTSVTTTADGDLVIAAALIHLGSGSGGGAPTGPSWTNSFVNQLSTGTGGTTPTDTYTFYAELVVGTAGAYATQASWTGNAGDRQELVIAFKAATGPQVVEVGTTTYLSANTATVTTASFTPANNCLLVAYCGMGNGTGGAVSLGTVSDSLSGTWKRLAGDVLTNGGVAEVWCRDVATGAAMTVTYDPGGTGASGNNIIVKQYVGAKPAAQQPGATALNAGASSYSKAIVTTATGSVVAGAFGRATSGVSLTANASTTILGQVNGSAGDTAATFRATALTTTPGSTTLGFTNGAAVANYIALAEILPTAADTPTAGPFTGSPPGRISPTGLWSPFPYAADAGVTPVALTDTAAAVDALSAAVTLTLTDTGAGSDTLSVAATVALADTAAGVDALTVAAAVPPADTGSGADAVTVAATVGLSDSASGADTLSATATTSLTDTATGADALTVSATVTLTDTGSGADNLAAGVPIAVTDTASASDALSVTVTLTLTDTPSAADSLAVAATVGLTDTGTAADTATVLAALALADSAAALDALGVTVAPTLGDSATALDAPAVAATVPLADAGAAADAFSHTVGGGATAITLTDSATAFDRMHGYVLRPGSGTTTRPNTGTVTRPNTGIVYWP